MANDARRIPAAKGTLILLALTLVACANVTIELAAPTATPQVLALPQVSTVEAIPTPIPAATLAYVVRPTVLRLNPKLLILATSTPEVIFLGPQLAEGQHISASGSYTGTQWTASGPMVCRIKRDTCAYHQLVGILDPTIIFYREEEPPYHTEDFLLHPAMLQPLTELSSLVQAEWGGTFQLRITDAYDSLLEHDLAQNDENRKYSLHFEGRAIDLTTSPVDRSRYGRLCWLAHQAGFDWVHNEGSHCHASIKAQSLCLRCGE